MLKSSFQEIESFLERAVQNRNFSGYALLVLHRGEVLFERVGGTTSWNLEGLVPHPVTPHTLFDLASLTKPLVTAHLAALLIQEGILSLDDRVGDFIREPLTEALFKTPVRVLLNHSSGLPDWKPYFSRIPRADPGSAVPSGGAAGTLPVRRLIYQFIHQEPLVYPPGTRNLYSDPGFILLGEILETKTGRNLDRLFQERIASPLGLNEVGFIPVVSSRKKGSGPFEKKKEFMATEKSDTRKKIIQGEVHDDNAYAMGGVAGHAGLFGTARGVYGCFREWRDGYFGKGKRLRSETVRVFTGRENFPGEWGLGWMFPSAPSSAGNLFSARSFGHLGFTGTSIWYDPEVDLGVVFLSNRVHPARDNNSLKELRPRLHDLIYQKVIHAVA